MSGEDVPGKRNPLNCLASMVSPLMEPELDADYEL